MRGMMKLGVAAVAMAVGMLGASASYALDDDFFTSYTQPANALVMPFDVTEGRESFQIVSNINGVSPISGGGANLGVTTHWAFWSETCDHLADVFICLTLNDTVVVDPHNVQAMDVANQGIGPVIDLSGERGIVVVTAYETDEICSDASVLGLRPVDDAIVGSYTFADTASTASFGADAIGLGLCDEFTDIECGPDAGDKWTQLPEYADPAIDVQTYNPETLDLSVVTLISLEERSGSGTTADIEVGPNTSTLSGDVTLYDNFEVATSLPNVDLKCVRFGSVIPADDDLIPSSISVTSSGFVRFSNFGVGDDTGEWVYIVGGQAVGEFGGSSNGKYKASFEF
jgi:hypothetical protein